MKLLWELNEEVDNELIHKITDELRISPITAKILVNRGLSDSDSISRFFDPELDQLHDPFLMMDMEKAVDRVIDALIEKERIFIYGDYDVDGITSVSMLYLFLKDLGGVVKYYIPDRQLDGYGLSEHGIGEAQKWGADLIISVDCGITSINEVNIAAEAGIDVIISDHHEPGEILPNAAAVINPKRLDCPYPFSELAGIGVAYKLANAISIKWGLSPSSHEKYIDLVAIGSAADIVPLINENRVFVKHGLAKLNEEGSIGIRALLETARLNKGPINVGQIVFGMAPRINAVGRLGNAERAVELLTTRDFEEAYKLAQILEDENYRRKQIDNLTLEEARQLIHDKFDPVNDRALVLAGKNWHSGVIGIVASRLIEQYYRPIIMISIEDGIGKGSARSIPGFDLYNAMKQCSNLLIQFGGHKYAAGLTIIEENIPEFIRLFQQIAAEIITDDDLIPKIHIDAEINLSDIDYNLVNELRMFAPFGPKNQKPLFLSRNLEVINPRMVGSMGQHLKFKVAQNGIEMDAIGFNLGNYYDIIMQNHNVVDIIYIIEENTWMNRTMTQLRVKDLR